MEFDYRLSPGFAVGRTAHLLRLAIANEMRQIDQKLSPEEAQLLLVLSAADAPISMGVFAKETMRDATTLTRQLDRLVERDLVRREPSPADRRMVLSSLTLQGRKVVSEAIPVLERVRGAAVANISAPDLDATFRALYAMQENLQAFMSS